MGSMMSLLKFIIKKEKICQVLTSKDKDNSGSSEKIAV
jgi:hypothetical protein